MSFEKFEVGDSVLYNGDCFDVLETLEDGSIDCCLSDPPYSSQTFGRCTDCEWDVAVDLPNLWRLVNCKTKPSANIVLFGNMKLAYDLINTNPKAFRYDLVWAKNNRTNFLNANLRPLSAHESICVFGKPGNMVESTYNALKTGSGRPRMNRTKARKTGGVYPPSQEGYTTVSDGTTHPISILAFDRDGVQLDHPTQKPLNLMGWLVMTYSNPGDIVLDMFSGSGTTLEAALRLNRRFIGIERERSYFDIACKRLEKAWQRKCNMRRTAFMSFPTSATETDQTDAEAVPIPEPEQNYEVPNLKEDLCQD